MRKVICAIIALVFLLGSCAAALAENKYVSIKDIRSTIPERWTGEYTDKKGNTVSIDTPIVVPEVDTVPVVRITWGGPFNNLDESLEVIENTRNVTTVAHDYLGYSAAWTDMEEGTAFSSSLSWDNAPSIASDTLRQCIPSIQDMQLTCYYQAAYGDSETNGEYWIHYYSTFHGIPYLVGRGFRMSADGE